MNGHDVMTLTQGYQGLIGIRLEDEEGQSIPDSAVRDVVITLGPTTRKMTDEENPVTYDAEEELWMFAVLQEDTLALDMGVYQLSAKVCFTDDNIVPADIAAVYVLPTNNKEVV